MSRRPEASLGDVHRADFLGAVHAEATCCRLLPASSSTELGSPVRHKGWPRRGLFDGSGAAALSCVCCDLCMPAGCSLSVFSLWTCGRKAPTAPPPPLENYPPVYPPPPQVGDTVTLNFPISIARWHTEVPPCVYWLDKVVLFVQ